MAIARFSGDRWIVETANIARFVGDRWYIGTTVAAGGGGFKGYFALQRSGIIGGGTNVPT